MVQARRRPVAPHRPSAANEVVLARAVPAIETRAGLATPGLAGFAAVVIVAGNLGLPLPGGYLAVDVLLVTIGFDLAQGSDPTTRPTSADGRWLKCYGLCLVGRIAAPVGLAVGLTALYEISQAPLDEPMTRAVLGAVTMTLNLFIIFGEAQFATLEHLWMIGVVIQFAVLAPLLVAGGRKRISRDQRTSAIIGLAVGVAICRLGFAAGETATYPSIAINTLTRVDGLLIGLAIGVARPEAVRRRMQPGMAAGAFAVLLLLFLAAPSQAERPVVALGALIPLVVTMTGIIVASTAAGALTGAISSTLNNQLMRWLGAMAISLYVWHHIFGSVLQIGLLGSVDTMARWPGLAIFALRIIFTLAAAATSYRYVELPALSRIRGAHSGLVSDRGKPPTRLLGVGKQTP